MTNVFVWLDRHPHAYWSVALVAALTLTLWILLGLRAPNRRPFRGDVAFPLLLLAMLVAWRWPYLLSAAEYNPDESQFIAGAITLRVDPVFWRSVDGTTSGPLNFYALLPLALAGLPLDYFTARLTGLLLCWGAVYALYQLFRTAAPPARAALAVFPSAAFFAASTDPDLVHYSSELVSVCLLAFALKWIASRPLVAAMLAGCLPWAKLQSTPLAAAVVGWQLFEVWRTAAPDRAAQTGRLLLAAASASTIIIALAIVGGEFDSLVRRYFIQNLSYVEQGGSLSFVAGELARRSQLTWHIPTWLAIQGLVLLGSILTRRHGIASTPLSDLRLGVILVAVAAASILAPAHSFLHYFLLLVVPLGYLAGLATLTLVARLPRAEPICVLAALLLFGVRLAQPTPEMIGQLAEHWRFPRTPLGEVLKHWSSLERRLVVWGWKPSAYVESGLAQGTRDALSVWALVPWSQRDYYRSEYLQDFLKARPELFVDAIGPGNSLLTDRNSQAHESFPPLAHLVQQNYRLITDLGHSRVYIRRDLPDTTAITDHELRTVISRGRLDWRDAPEPERSSATRTRLVGETVWLLPAPAFLCWPLQGTEREIRITFGFHPRAASNGTDGASLIAELLIAGHPPLHLAEEFLDPKHRPADTRSKTRTLTLPPFPPGTQLRLRTTAGPAGDSAWDWIYLRHLAFLDSSLFIRRQFPGFARPPDSIDAVYPHLLQRESRMQLMLPPPTTIGFVLDGSERNLRFQYGLLTGAYTNGGSSDGVTFRVRIRRSSDASVQVLFERHLAPGTNPTDQGEQESEVRLPGNLAAGDQLMIELRSGADANWDWSYLSALELR